MDTDCKNELVIYLKSGITIEVLSESTSEKIQKTMSLEKGSCISFGGGSFIVCSEIAAVMVKNK